MRMAYESETTCATWRCPYCQRDVLFGESHVCGLFQEEARSGLYGWICPKCGMVMAPHVQTCQSCGPSTAITSTMDLEIQK